MPAGQSTVYNLWRALSPPAIARTLLHRRPDREATSNPDPSRSLISYLISDCVTCPIRCQFPIRLGLRPTCPNAGGNRAQPRGCPARGREYASPRPPPRARKHARNPRGKWYPTHLGQSQRRRCPVSSPNGPHPAAVSPTGIFWTPPRMENIRVKHRACPACPEKIPGARAAIAPARLRRRSGRRFLLPRARSGGAWRSPDYATFVARPTRVTFAESGTGHGGSGAMDGTRAGA